MDLSLFGIGLPQILLIMVVALLVFGPEKLPEMARQAGRWVGRLRAWMQDARNELKTITEVQEEFKTIKEDLATIRKDLAETSQEVLKELDDVRKEVDVRSELTDALSDKPLEQYTYHVTENGTKSEAARDFARLETELAQAGTPATLSLDVSTPENDMKMVSLVEDALNDANATSLATNGHKPGEEITDGTTSELSGEVAVATSQLETIAAENDSSYATTTNTLLQDQIAAILNNQEKFQKDFSVLVRHISELTERVSGIEQHPLLTKPTAESREETRKAAEMI